MGLFFKRKKENSIEQQLNQLTKTKEENQQNIFNKDENISNRDSFSMTIIDIFTITGRGSVITGTVEAGSISTGDVVYINSKHFKVKSIESFRKIKDSANKGDNIGLLIDTVKSEISPGQIVTK